MSIVGNLSALFFLKINKKSPFFLPISAKSSIFAANLIKNLPIGWNTYLLYNLHKSTE